MLFQLWKSQYAPKDSGYDYDLRGAFKAGLTPDPKTGHWPDTFKKPNHPTFSNESIYAKIRPDLAGQWAGANRDQYVSPSPIGAVKQLQLTRPSILKAKIAPLAQAMGKMK
jgi:hypothetical protein